MEARVLPKFASQALRFGSSAPGVLKAYNPIANWSDYTQSSVFLIMSLLQLTVLAAATGF
jgi:hypothetical protein